MSRWQLDFPSRHLGRIDRPHRTSPPGPWNAAGGREGRRTFGYKPRWPGPAPKRCGSLLLGRPRGTSGRAPLADPFNESPPTHETSIKKALRPTAAVNADALFIAANCGTAGCHRQSPGVAFALARSPMAVTKYVRNPRVMPGE
ncbi:hypothetical protein MRX96_010647 [Rhipicephalus microplus]